MPGRFLFPLPLLLACGDGGRVPREKGDESWLAGVSLLSEEPLHEGDPSVTLRRYELGPAPGRDLQAPDGERPRFWVIQAAARPALPGPLLLLLHGGSLDVETDREPIGRYGRCTSAYTADLTRRLAVGTALVDLFVAEGGVVVIPEDAGCDGWVGMGPLDPVDPHHLGFAVAEAAVGFVQAGGADGETEGLVVGGGSRGAGGSVWFAAHHPGVQALLFDSGLPDLIREHEDPAYNDEDLAYRQACLEHVMGDAPFVAGDSTAPSAAWSRYEDWSLMRTLQGGGWTVPVFHIWNTQDLLSPASANDELVLALDESGLRHHSWNTDHGEPLHGQIPDRDQRGPAWAAHRFLRGDTLHRFEAEEADGDDLIGQVEGGDRAPRGASQQSVRTAVPADGAGVLVRWSLPTTDIGANARLFVALEGESRAEPSATVARLRVEDADGSVVAEQSLVAESLPPTLGGDSVKNAAAIEAATLSYVGGDAPLWATVEVVGNANLRVDTMLLAVEP